MTQTIKAACIQMNSGIDITENCKTAEALIREAAAAGATLITTPEVTDQIRRYTRDRLATSGNMQTHIAIPHFSALAKALKIWLLIGSIGVKVTDDKLANRSILFAPDGTIKQTYDKIHMFDVTLSRTEFYKESSEFAAGNQAKLATISSNEIKAKIGMGICYDLRFPHLWRDLAKAGVSILTAPAAFTVPTGQAHWEILLRARAIETGCFILAPAQTGEHEAGRKTYGHSMIINPWGKIIASMDDDIGFITANLNMEEVQEARSKIPALTHDRDYKI